MAKNTDIDFIFRPHPLLFAQLAKEDCWGETKTQVYLDKVCALIMLLTLHTEQCWTEFGKKCVGVHYGIYNAKDLDTFIESVRNGQDALKERRIAFAKNEVMINYPHATQKIYENLVQSILARKNK